MEDQIFNNDFEKELNAVFDEMEQKYQQEKEGDLKRKYIIVGKGAKQIVSEYERDLKQYGELLYILKKEPQKKIKSFVAGADVIVLLVAIGGDSGRKYIKEIGALLQKLNVFTIAILVEPLLSEGRGSMVKAERCIDEVQNLFDCIIPVRDQDDDFINSNYDDLNSEAVQTIFFLNDTMDTSITFENGFNKFKLMLQQAEAFKMYSIITDKEIADNEYLVEVLYENSALQLNVEDAKIAVVALYVGKNISELDIAEIQYNIEEMLKEKAELFFCTMIHDDPIDCYEIDILLGTYPYKRKTKFSSKVGKSKNNKVELSKEKNKDEALLNAISLSQLCINLLSQNNSTHKNEILQQLEKLKKDLRSLCDDEK